MFSAFFALFIALFSGVVVADDTTDSTTPTCTTCYETERQCVVRYAVLKSLRDATEECCIIERKKNGMTDILSRYNCCLTARLQFNLNETEVCRNEICYFNRVELEALQMRVDFVVNMMPNVFLRAEEFSTEMYNSDRDMATLIASNTYTARVEYNATVDLLGEVPWSRFATKAATQFLADVSSAIEKSTTDPEEQRALLLAKYDILFAEMQAFGQVYDAVAEMTMRETFFEQWKETLNWTSIVPHYAMTPIPVSQFKLPTASPLDLFEERQALRSNVISQYTDRRDVQCRGMCRQPSVGRPPDSKLQYAEPAWKSLHQQWVQNDLAEWRSEFKAFRTAHLYNERTILGRLKKILADDQSNH